MQDPYFIARGFVALLLQSPDNKVLEVLSISSSTQQRTFVNMVAIFISDITFLCI